MPRILPILPLCAAMMVRPAPAQDNPGARAAIDNTAAMSKQIADLTALVQKLQARVDALEGKLGSGNAAGTAAPSSPQSDVSARAQSAKEASLDAQAAPNGQTAPATETANDFNILRGTTLNLYFDGYYGYNFNAPIGRANLLRAYDVSSNAFSLSQADLVLENAPDPDHGRRFGFRLDLQFGQATATLQGNASNEPRPEVYRNIFQAYGTYVAPIGSGLTIDFGKWASSLGMEGNYGKDQINYSRSYWYNFLPFYHTGARLSYKVNNAITLNYWITNGTGQTEPFNGYKDELFGLSLQPHRNVSWIVNYYLGQEHPDFEYVPGSTQPGLPTLQGIPFEPIPNPANGNLHIIDTYATWTVTPKLTLAAELDDEIERLLRTSPPARTDGGAAYFRYQLSSKLAIASRGEWFFDHGGLFTGTTNTLHEATLTFEQKVYDGFLVREEYRRDFASRPYFLTDTLGILKKDQTTATLGLIWWFGAKKGAW